MLTNGLLKKFRVDLKPSKSHLRIFARNNPHLLAAIPLADHDKWPENRNFAGQSPYLLWAS